MKKLLICLALLCAPLSSKTTTYLSPQGDWPLCKLGIQMPGCAIDQAETYMLLTDSIAPWTITATLESGETVVMQGTGQTFNLDFGGIVTNWTIAFKRQPVKR